MGLREVSNSGCRLIMGSRAVIVRWLPNYGRIVALHIGKEVTPIFVDVAKLLSFQSDWSVGYVLE